jgi:hypothetical protein
MLLLCVQCLEQDIGCLERGVRRPDRVRVAAQQSALFIREFLNQELHHAQLIARSNPLKIGAKSFMPMITPPA